LLFDRVNSKYLDPLHEKMDKQGKITLLNQLMNNDKFDDEAWTERGLNPSNPEISQVMNQLINEIIEQITVALEADSADETLKQIIVSELNKIDEDDFDTEELEFLCDWYVALASLAGVDIHNELNKFLYGELGQLL